MGLPGTVRVKLSSEAAEAISLTPVVVQEIPIRELVEYMLVVAGKDSSRIRELLRRGTLVSGASRFRWQGFEAEAEALDEVLASFPDPDPSRSFAAAACLRAVLLGGRRPVELSREAVSRKGLFERAAFWDLLLETVAAGEIAYSGYSYRERADRYTREFVREEIDRLRAAASAVRYSTLRDQIQTAAFRRAELFVGR